MAQPNWWEDDEVVDGPAPAAPEFPGVIPGRPKVPPPPTPLQIRADERAERAADRADETAARSAAKDAEGTGEERTAGFLAGRIVDAIGRLSQAGQADPSSLKPTLGVEAARKVLGDTAANFLTDAERQQVRAAQIDILDAALTLGTGAAYTKEQIEGYREAYFPQLGDDPSTIKSKQDALRSLLQNAQIKAGRAAPDIEKALAALDALNQPVGAGGGQRQDTDIDTTGLTPAQVKALEEAGPPPPGERLVDWGYNEDGTPYPVFGTTGGPTEAEKIANDPRFAEPDSAVLARQGFTMGLSDEAAGIGGAISNALMLKNPIKGYQLWNSVEDAQIERARARLGGLGTAIEIGSSFGGVGTGGALTRLTVGQAGRQGAAIGALGGYGYGEGLEGSTINAAGGAALGFGVGAGAQALGNAFAPSLSSRAAAVQARALRAEELAKAGAAEGVTVNRAMVDPALANRVTGVDATISGGPRVQGGMREIEGQIENRVTDLGRGGSAMDDIALGDQVKASGERFIEKSGKAAKRKYDRAERLAGGAKVEPKESLARADAMLETLRETPGTLDTEIAYLEKIRGDLTRDLSVGALRRMRTNLRKKISKGDLVFGEDEARVLAIMDGAAEDITAGLTAQGKQEAARAFETADKAYRARMEYITGTVQKILGKRGASLSAEQIAGKFQSMSRNDARGLRKFYATLTPDEAADVSATFAEQIGINNKGEFSVAHFLSQTAPEKMSDEALRTIFGPEGAQSVKNLRVLGKEVNRVTSAMNSRTSKTGVANNYKDWLYNIIGGGGLGGVASGGNWVAMGGAAAAGAGAKLTRDALTARALMSPKITKWLRQAPSTTNAAAIDRHFAKLGDIVKAEPALAGDIETLRNAIMQAANDNSAVVTGAAAEPDDKQD